MIESLTAALKSARLFEKQTAERVSSMKLEVLQAYEDDESGQDSQYKRDVTAKIVALVEERSQAVDDFKKSQDQAEKCMADLAFNPDSPSAAEQREKIVKHFEVHPAIRPVPSAAQSVPDPRIAGWTGSQAGPRLMSVPCGRSGGR